MSQQSKQESNHQRKDQKNAVEGAFLLVMNLIGVDNQQIGNPNQCGKAGKDDGHIQDEQLQLAQQGEGNSEEVTRQYKKAKGDGNNCRENAFEFHRKPANLSN